MKNNESIEPTHGTEQMDEPRLEYDFSGGIRGKYVGRIQSDTVMVTLEPDVAAAFPDARSVNEALRLLLMTAKNATKLVAPAA